MNSNVIGSVSKKDSIRKNQTATTAIEKENIRIDLPLDTNVAVLDLEAADLDKFVAFVDFEAVAVALDFFPLLAVDLVPFAAVDLEAVKRSNENRV